MRSIPCELLINLHNELGEGPVWDERENRLLWIDGFTGHWFCMKDGDVKEFAADSKLGSIVLKSDGNLAAATKNGIFMIDAATGEYRFFLNPETDMPGNRWNDGKVDPAGRYVVGTMSEANNDGSGNGRSEGALYSICADGSWKKLLEGVGISNGLAWNRAHDTLFYVDSPTGCIQAFDYDVKTGAISNGRVCARIPENEGIPDGMTVDADDNLWVAQWGGWCVSCYNPQTGERLAKIDVPVEHVTCCTFGGTNMDELYITTAATGVAGIQWLKQPLAGGMFVAHPNVKGLAAFRFGEEART